MTKKMKIAIFVGDDSIKKNQAGGSETFLRSVLEAFSTNKQIKHEIVALSFHKKNNLGLPNLYIKHKDFSKYRIKWNYPWGLNSIIGKILFKIKKILFLDIYHSLAEAYYHHFEYYKLDEILLSNKIDLLYFPTPTYIPVKVPTIVTLWDLAHRNYPFFPEVDYVPFGWVSREKMYRTSLLRAAYVIVGTQAGKQEVIQFYNVLPERIRVLPFPVPPYMERAKKKLAISSERNPLPQNSISNYIFYPAQFWPHKNHANLLRALKHLHVDYGLKLKLVLTGSDKGNLNYIKELIIALKLQQSIQILGFVKYSELILLYEKAICMVFPSFFGPDNLPPLEAFALNCPVVAAKMPGSEEQLGNAALLFDPSNFQDMAKCIYMIYSNSDTRETLLENGRELIRNKTIKHYIIELEKLFNAFEAYRYCWSSTEEYVHL